MKLSDLKLDDVTYTSKIKYPATGKSGIEPIDIPYFKEKYKKLNFNGK
jgi:hypothetical protein